MVKQKVTLNIHTIHVQDESKEENHIQAEGELIQRGDMTYLRYQENLSDKENALVRTTLKIDQKQSRLLVMRNGAIKMNQVFLLGQETKGIYETMYGSISMHIKTKKLSYQPPALKKHGQLLLTYALQMGDADLATISLNIDVHQ